MQQGSPGAPAGQAHEPEELAEVAVSHAPANPTLPSNEDVMKLLGSKLHILGWLHALKAQVGEVSQFNLEPLRWMRS